MIKIDKAENCTIVDTMHVDKIETPQMIVQQQFVGKDGSPNQNLEFDIDRFPSRHFAWVRGVNDKARKEEILVMRQEMAEEAERHEDISRHKSEILNTVFEPRIVSQKVKSIPSHQILLDLFGSCIDGIAKKAHNEWKRELEWKHWHRKATRGCK